MNEFNSIEEIAALVGTDREFVTDWLPVEQADVSDFARITRDMDIMHIDPEWARKNSPYGGTIAFGFQMLSLLTYFNYQALPRSPETAFALNYGLDRVRFIEPVPVDDRVRNRIKVTGFDKIAKGYRIATHNTIELESSETPAVIADWIGLLITEEQKGLHTSAAAAGHG